MFVRFFFSRSLRELKSGLYLTIFEGYTALDSSKLLFNGIKDPLYSVDLNICWHFYTLLLSVDFNFVSLWKLIKKQSDNARRSGLFYTFCSFNYDFWLLILPLKMVVYKNKNFWRHELFSTKTVKIASLNSQFWQNSGKLLSFNFTAPFEYTREYSNYLLR